MTAAEHPPSRTAAQECPDTSALRAVFDGRSDPGTRTHVLSHLGTCEACCDRFAELEPLVPSFDAVPVGDGVLVGERYRLRERVGRGQWGEVWLATDERLRQSVALKLLLPSRLLNPDDHARVAREAEMLAQLRHANIVGVHDHGVHEGRPYLVMEYVEGAPLSEHLRSPKRSTAHIVALFVQAAAGLAAAHRAAVVHRDFKPDNILVDAAGRVRVIDFGLAASACFEDEASEPAAGPHDDASWFDLRLTPTAAILGTPAYMAPELWRGALATPGSDQFAYCVAFAEALLAAPLLSRADIRAGPVAVDELERRLRGVPAWLRPVLLRGLHPEPSARHRDIERLVDEIHRRQQRRRLGRGLAAIATVAMAFGFAAYGVRHHRIDACMASATASAIARGGDDSDAVATTREALEDYRAHRLEQVAEVCHAAGGRPQQAEPGVRARHYCLEEARVTESVVARVMLGDPQVVRGWHLLGRLPPLSACNRPDERAIAAYNHFAEAGVERQERLVALLADEHVADVRLGLEEFLAEDDLPPAFRADVHVAIAAQLANAGDLPAAEASFRKALALALASSHHRASLVALLALVRMAGPDDARADLLLALAEPLAEATEAMPTYLHARSRRHLERGRIEEAMTDIDRALSQPESSSGPLARLRRRQTDVRLQGTNAEILRQRGEHGAALSAARARAIEQRALGGEDAVYARQLAQLGGYAERAGEASEAEASFRSAAELLEALDELALSLRARVERARQLVHLARWDEAVVELRESIARAEQSGALQAQASGATFLAYIHETRGESAAWLEACRKATTASAALHGPDHVRTLEAEVFCTDGYGDDAPGRRRLARIARDAAASLPELSARDAVTARGVLHRAHTRLARSALERDDLDGAEQHARAAIEFRADGTDDGHTSRIAELLLAQILTRRGEITLARDAADTALAVVLADENRGRHTAVEVAEHLELAADVFRRVPGGETRARLLLADADRHLIAAGLRQRVSAPDRPE